MAPNKFFPLSLVIVFLALAPVVAAEQMGPIYGEDVIVKGSGHKRIRGEDTLEVIPLEGAVIAVLRGDLLVVKLRGGKERKLQILGIECQTREEPWGAPAIVFSRKVALGRSGLILNAGKNEAGLMQGFFIIDNHSLGLLLVRSGLAQVSTGWRRFTARGAFSRYRRVQMGAIASRKGMWGWRRPE